MKCLKHLALSVLLVLAMMTSTLAAEVPVSLVVENLNGLQRIVKTYELPSGTDPEALKEPSFDYDGFTYSWAYTTKQEHTFQETKNVTEKVTVETDTKNLDQILEQLASTIPYDDGEFCGELALDHSTLSTEAAGYTTKSGSVTATKTIGPLDRNDMSYIPATTVKDGRTLNLVNVEWQVIGTDLVGDTLSPSAYQAVATYSASTSSQVATGYVTTAEYKGAVTTSGVSSVTYTVVYAGTEISPVAEGMGADGTRGPIFSHSAAGIGSLFFLIPLLLALVLLGIYFYLNRKNVYVYVPGDRPHDYRLVAKFRVEAAQPEVDISDLEPYPESTVAVEIKRPLAKKLLGRTFTVHHRIADYTYTVLQDRPGDWHEFDPTEEQEEIT